MKKPTITAAIIAKDEEKHIGACIESVSWADEVLVVDTGSNDNTVKVAKEKGARVIEYFKGLHYSDWRNKALEESSGTWILYVDADERVSSELKGEILQTIKKGKHFAYVIPRSNVFLGKELKHGGWYPDYVKRLFHENHIEGWRGELHEEPMIDVEFGKLDNPLTHIAQESLSEMVEKTNKWSEVEAKLMYDKKHPNMTIPRFMSAMLREFWYRMVLKKAFMDGPVGMIVAIYQVYSKFISYAKLWEMQKVGVNKK